MGKIPPLRFGAYKKLKPRYVPMNEVLGLGGHKEAHFAKSKKKVSLTRQRATGVLFDTLDSTHKLTFRGKHSWHNTFFRDNSSEIRSFADVGCGLLEGAPTTVEIREVLPENAKVMAVDIRDEPESKEIGDIVMDAVTKNLGNKGVDVLEHSIVEEPLPHQVDAIRFALVSYLLTGKERQMAIVNIHKSLKPGGFLLSHMRAYRKTKGGFEEIAERMLGQEKSISNSPRSIRRTQD